MAMATCSRIETLTRSKQTTKSYVDSVTFMKKLTLYGLSNILYKRKVFPKDAFKCIQDSNIDMNVLIEDSSSPVACDFFKLIANVYDAIHNKYLEKLIFCIDKDNSLIESYIFKYEYKKCAISIENKINNESSNLEVCKIEEIKKSFENLWKTFDTARPNKLPSDFTISLNLLYYNNVPDEYNPTGFSQSSEFEMDEIYQKYVFGCIETPFHKFSLYGYYNKKSISEESAQHDDNESNSSISSIYEKSTDVEMNDKSSFTFGFPKFSAIESLVHEGRSSTSVDSDIRCSCDMSFNGTILIKCDYCHNFQHAACFGLLKEHVKAINSHCCDTCASHNPKLNCTDPKLIALDSRKKQALCIFRLTLAYCLQCNEVDSATLAETFLITKQAAIKVILRLQHRGVFINPSPSKNLRLSQIRIVNHFFLKNKVIPNYFQSFCSESSNKIKDVHSISKKKCTFNKCPNIRRNKIFEGQKDEKDERLLLSKVKKRLTYPSTSYSVKQEPVENVNNYGSSMNHGIRRSFRLSTKPRKLYTKMDDNDEK